MYRLVMPLSKEHSMAIGNVTAYFALIDSQLSVCIWILIDCEQKMGDIITTDLSFKQKMVLFQELYLYRNDNEEKLEKLGELVRRLSDAEERRNSITHSTWGANKNPKDITRIKTKISKTRKKYKSGLKYTFEDMSTKDLEKIVESFGELAYDLSRFLD